MCRRGTEEFASPVSKCALNIQGLLNDARQVPSSCVLAENLLTAGFYTFYRT
jgi:hypothetical protein